MLLVQVRASGLLVLLLRLATMSSAWAPVSRTFTVDWQGRGDFRTVQSAVDSVPDGNSEWIRIHVTAGEYREKVTIPKSKSYILLEGEGSWTTQISFDDHAYPSINEIMSRGDAGINAMVNGDADVSTTFRSATFTVLSDIFVARNIAFKNTYNTVNPTAAPDQAVAALVAGDKAAFYDCAFFGYQDTLCDFLGRHYFLRCYIEGAVDSIFGFGQSIYEACKLSSNMPPNGQLQQPGWVTAHARQQPSSPGGLVFKGCTLEGTGRQFLGRAWNRYATVVFYGTLMSDVVVPEGWEAWNAGSDVGDVTFAEDSCSGPGSGISRRVTWEKKLSVEEGLRFVDIRFIDDGWLSNGPELTNAGGSEL